MLRLTSPANDNSTAESLERIERHLRNLLDLDVERLETERRTLIAQDTANFIAYMQLNVAVGDRPNSTADRVVRERLGL